MDKEMILKEDFEFEYAKAKGVKVETYQNGFKVYSAGVITAYSTDHVAINGKKIHRGANTFVVVE